MIVFHVWLYFFLVGGSCAKECVQQLACRIFHARRCFCMVTRDRSLRVTGAMEVFVDWISCSLDGLDVACHAGQATLSDSRYCSEA